MTSKIRTEEEILKDFEKLGWFVGNGFANFVLEKLEREQDEFLEIHHHCYISINKEKHTYSAIDLHCYNTHRYSLSMQEHQLLHELFICYGWL